MTRLTTEELELAINVDSFSDRGQVVNWCRRLAEEVKFIRSAEPITMRMVTPTDPEQYQRLIDGLSRETTRAVLIDSSATDLCCGVYCDHQGDVRPCLAEGEGCCLSGCLSTQQPSGGY